MSIRLFVCQSASFVCYSQSVAADSQLVVNNCVYLVIDRQLDSVRITHRSEWRMFGFHSFNLSLIRCFHAFEVVH